VVCTTYRLTEQYHYWTKNNPMNVQLIPEPFVEIPVELADRNGNSSKRKIKVTSARGTYVAKAFVTRRIKPMMIDGKRCTRSVCRSIKASGASLRTKDEMIERLRTCFRQR